MIIIVTSPRSENRDASVGKEEKEWGGVTDGYKNTCDPRLRHWAAPELWINHQRRWNQSGAVNHRTVGVERLLLLITTQGQLLSHVPPNIISTRYRLSPLWVMSSQPSLATETPTEVLSAAPWTISLHIHPTHVSLLTCRRHRFQEVYLPNDFSQYAQDKARHTCTASSILFLYEAATALRGQILLMSNRRKNKGIFLSAIPQYFS